MNYEKQFKRFTADLLALIEKHFREWDEAEGGRVYYSDTFSENADSKSSQITDTSFIIEER